MSAGFVSNRDETIPLFESPWLERLSHVHPATPAVVFLPIVAVLLYYGLPDIGWGLASAQLLLGLFIWTFTEYALHRWVFHYEPTSTFGKRIHFLMHGIHHDYPRDSTRLVMPPPVSLPLATLFWALFRVLFGAYYEPIFAGFLLGYVAYDTIHYATHHWKSEGRLSKFLKEYHLRHHYIDDHRAYGVSSPLWDWVFGTYAQPPERRARVTA